MTLAILLPTRGRPHNLQRFITATAATAADWHLYLRFDDDDSQMYLYDEVLANWEHCRDRITVTHGLRIGFAASLNQLATIASIDGRTHLGMFGDDVVPETLEWDTALVNALGSRLGVSYGDDGLRKKHAPDLPTHYVTQTEVFQRLGYLAPFGIRHLFLDNVARDIGRYLRNFKFVPVSIRHLHPWAEGEEFHDQTYAEGGRNSEIRVADQAAYQRWAANKTWKLRLKS